MDILKPPKFKATKSSRCPGCGQPIYVHEAVRIVKISGIPVQVHAECWKLVSNQVVTR